MERRKIVLEIIHDSFGSHGVKGIHAVTQRLESNEKEEYLIGIDTDGKEEEQTEAFIHEMLHIYHGDLLKDNLNVNECEYYRHKETEQIVKALKERGAL